ncbi:MAG: hypothetical protein FWE32_10725 [Oscillospiraceae bacterium]|nr:hypothetical protein [Oscillospiraceae bacterium]
MKIHAGKLLAVLIALSIVAGDFPTIAGARMAQGDGGVWEWKIEVDFNAAGLRVYPPAQKPGANLSGSDLPADGVGIGAQIPDAHWLWLPGGPWVWMDTFETVMPSPPDPEGDLNDMHDSPAFEIVQISGVWVWIPDPPKVTEVRVSPAATAVYAGEQVAFIAEVMGTNNPSQAVIWSVEPRSDTVIEDGWLTVLPHHAGGEITVWAISAEAPGMSGYARVRVDVPTFTVTGSVAANGATVALYSGSSAGIDIPVQTGGTFSLTLPAGAYRLRISAPGLVATTRAFEVTNAGVSLGVINLAEPLRATGNGHFGTDREWRAINIINDGDENLVLADAYLTGHGAHLFELSFAMLPPGRPVIIPSGGSVTIQVRPNPNQTAGVGRHTADLFISGDYAEGEASDTIELSFTVSGPPDSTVPPPLPDPPTPPTAPPSGGGGRDTSDRTSTPRTPLARIAQTGLTVLTDTNVAGLVRQAVAAAAPGSLPTVTMTNQADISLTAIQRIVSEANGGPVRVFADTLNNSGTGVDVRIVFNPAQATAGINLRASTTNAFARQAVMIFEHYFGGSAGAISLGQTGDFGMEVRLAARIPPNLDTDALFFYAYDRNANTFRRFIPTAQRVDANGFLHFTTTMAGDIVITNQRI